MSKRPNPGSRKEFHSLRSRCIDVTNGVIQQRCVNSYSQHLKRLHHSGQHMTMPTNTKHRTTHKKHKAQQHKTAKSKPLLHFFNSQSTSVDCRPLIRSRMQLIIKSTSTYVVDVSELVNSTGYSLRSVIAHREHITIDSFYLKSSGRIIHDNSTLNDGTYDVSFRVLGGKGGFGSMLRSMAKRSGSKPTTDFGLCRDLNGRRLRHVNDEEILKRWKDAKERGEEFDVEENTKTGIDLWFLDAPTWAEGVKGKARKRFLKRHAKTTMCIDWERAREKSDPPAGSPAWWGCPRGERCEFAHGEEELRGALKERQKEEAREAEWQERQRYLQSIETVPTEEAMLAAVKQGMQAKKRIKLTPQSENTAMEVAADNSTSGASIEDNSWIEIKQGAAECSSKGVVCGKGEFCTIAVSQCCLKRGRYYYEVTVATRGLMQIGWATSAMSLQSAEDGIGDCLHSFAFDGARSKVWHEVDVDYGASWEVGDTLGCYIDCQDVTRMYFSLNGVNMGEAFSVPALPDDQYYYPALSLEGGEIAIVNVGQHPFKYNDGQPSSSVDLDVPYRPVLCMMEKVPFSLAAADVTLPPLRAQQQEEQTFDAVNLESDAFATLEAVKQLGLKHLKAELERRGLKAGGTLDERAARLFSVRGLSEDKISDKIKAKVKK